MQHKKAKAAVEAGEADRRVLSGGIVIEGAHGSISASLQFAGAAKGCPLKKHSRRHIRPARMSSRRACSRTFRPSAAVATTILDTAPRYGVLISTSRRE